MGSYVIKKRYLHIFRHLRPAMKLLKYVGLSRTNFDPEELNRAYQLAKKVNHLNCDIQMVINIYFNYSQSQCIPQVGSFKTIETLVNYFEESVLLDEQILRFSDQLNVTAKADSITPIITQWKQIEKVWDSCLNFLDFSRFKVSLFYQ